jgi:alkyldihydroxyacetonephosphate synthase
VTRRAISIDTRSLLVEVAGGTPLAEVEAELAEKDLTLGLDPHTPMSSTVAAWIAEGAPGARDPWKDPVDHLVAGLDARLANGHELRVRPAPRRATGPDLVALLFGARGRFGEVARAHLRVHRKGARRADTHPLMHPRDPEPTHEERALLDAIASELFAR